MSFSLRATPRFTAAVNKFISPPGPDGCKIWKGSIDEQGRAVFFPPWRLPHPLKAHRVVWELEFGEDAPERITRTCRNQLCVNVDHMEAKSRRLRLVHDADAPKKSAAVKKHEDHIYRLREDLRAMEYRLSEKPGDKFLAERVQQLLLEIELAEIAEVE